MTIPTQRNRLTDEESPYLRDHADNPVNWQPWDQQALETAQEHDVPIFLSIGYAACHWCHVMADESFADEAVAEILNEDFVPIKVDREERPDIDSIYQTICQQVSGRGGWPLSVWLTPDQEPFYVGTYFPKRPKRGTPGFIGLLEDIRDSWQDPTERSEIEGRATQWSEAVEEELESVPETPIQPDEQYEDPIVEIAAKAAVRSADREEGGWGSGPKFPHTGRIHLLLRAWDLTDRSVYRAVATETLDAMASGGMYDHIGGGFHRYATDRDWTVPHFEKMLYDNAELSRAYLAAYQATGEDRYATVASQSLEFVQRELTDDDGGFYGTLGAQSETAGGEHEEGAYYVWTPEEIHDVIEDSEAATLCCDHYGVTEGGNFEGSSVLNVERSVEQLADSHGLNEDEVEKRLASAREALAGAREARPRPPRDEKILAGWNGLAVSAFAEAGLALDREFAESGVAALRFVEERLWNEDTQRLQRRYMNGVPKFEGYLEDYAYLGRGALDLYQATGEPEHLSFAVTLARAIEREFWDENDQTLYFTPESGEQLITRPQELNDQSTPSSAGVAAELFETLSHFLPDADFWEIADSVVRTHGSRIKSNPLQHASLTLAADTVQRGTLELTAVTDVMPAKFRETIAKRYLSPRLLARRPPEDGELGHYLDALDREEVPPIWKGRSQKNDEPTIYACRDGTCSPPRNNVRTALDWADRML